ncbi:hypothetical protein [Aliikangiella maris]|uniref:Uncharacterized protein n=2 Tax=Aliikangiella maris TaxID=3162458 RepID=A0ABV2BV12_9GAMM
MPDSHAFEQSSRLGNLIVKKGWISLAQLEEALDYQVEHHCRLGQSLLELGYISAGQLDCIIKRQQWMRKILAGIVLVTTPICPVLANEKAGTIRFTVKTQETPSDNLWQQAPLNSPQEILLNQFNKLDYHVGITHQFSHRSGISFELEKRDMVNQAHLAEAYYPQISIFTASSKVTAQNSLDSVNDTAKITRSDRYKDTLPVVYRLTLKGYCIYEQTDEHIKYWAMERVKDSPYKKYELMFSITKNF